MPILKSDKPRAGRATAAARHGQYDARSAPDTAGPTVATACHDLRQPLQSLVLLHALLARTVEGERAQVLVGRLKTSIDGMTAVLERLANAKSADTEIKALTPEVAAVQPAANVVAAPSDNAAFAPVVFIVDDDSGIRAAIRGVLEDDGQVVEEFASCELFLEHDRRERDGCLLIDAYLPGMGGLELLQLLQTTGQTLPAIMITGDSDVAMAVNAMKAGAMDFIEKPIGRSELLACIARAVEQSKDLNKQLAWRQDAARHVAGLTARQHEIMAMVLAGHPSKNIAADLGISQRTVENHRASIMKRTGAKSLPALARLAMTAAAATAA